MSGIVDPQLLVISKARSVDSSFYDLLKVTSTRVAEIGGVFAYNLGSAAKVSYMPYMMAHGMLYRTRIAHAQAANLVKLLPRNVEETNISDWRSTLEEAVRNDVEEWHNTKGTIETWEELLRLLQDADFERMTRDLLMQTTVMVWGSLEVLATDLAVYLLNRFPALADPILLDRYSKAEILKIIRDAPHGVGSKLYGERGLDSLGAIRSTYEVILPKSQRIRNVLNSNRDLEIMHQRRCVIVHRRGIVDEAYLNATKEPETAGQPLNLTAPVVSGYFELIGRIGHELLLGVHEYCLETDGYA